MNEIEEQTAPNTITAQITQVDKSFLREAKKNKDVLSKSEAVRQGLKLLRKETGYSEKTGLKEAA